MDLTLKAYTNNGHKLVSDQRGSIESDYHDVLLWAHNNSSLINKTIETLMNNEQIDTLWRKNFLQKLLTVEGFYTTLIKIKDNPAVDWYN